VNCGIISAARRRSAAAGDPNFSSVKLLMGFEGANGSTSFVDESPVGRTMTAVGNAQITTSQFKFGSSCATFDGSGDRITTPDSADWDFGTGPYTIEGFFRFQTKTTNQALLGQWDTGPLTNCAWYFYLNGSNLTMRMANATFGIVDMTYAFTPTLGTWYYICVERDATGKTRFYLGTTGTASMVQSGASILNFAPFNSTAKLVLGAIGDTNGAASFDFNGNMDEIKITKGVARYASDAGVTIPTAAFPRS
jgi:hypothetical protein